MCTLIPVRFVRPARTCIRLGDRRAVSLGSCRHTCPLHALYMPLDLWARVRRAERLLCSRYVAGRRPTVRTEPRFPMSPALAVCRTFSPDELLRSCLARWSLCGCSSNRKNCGRFYSLLAESSRYAVRDCRRLRTRFHKQNADLGFRNRLYRLEVPMRAMWRVRRPHICSS